jgi:flagellar hook-associated protein 3 FlgL
MSGQLVQQIQSLQERINKDQGAVSSGKKVRTSDDDPAGYRRSMEIRASQLLTQQFRDATGEVKNRAQSNYNAASQLQTIVARASELASRLNGTLNTSDMAAYATEMNNLLEQAVSLGNRQSDGQFLFGGTFLQPTDMDGAALYVPFRVTRNGAGQITAVTYRGNAVVSQIDIDESSSMDYNLLGSSAGTPRGLFINGAVNVFDQLITLRDQLFAGNAPAVQNPGIANLRLVEDNVAVVLGLTGANMYRLNFTTEAHTQKLQADESLLSSITDADLAEMIISLQQKQTTLQGALQTGAQVLNLSLLNFI